MTSVRCWANAGRRLGQSPVSIFCTLNSPTRSPILKNLSTSSVILKDNSSSFSKDGFKKSAPPPPMSSGGSRGHRDGLSCPKCGDPCTHVETFVSKFIHWRDNNFIFANDSLGTFRYIIIFLFFFSVY